MSLKTKLMEVYWNIAIVERQSKNLQNDLKNVHWVKHNYRDGWFADPFILDYNDTEIEILVEEFYFATKKGRITLLVVDRESFELKDVRCLLQLPTHLSFPAYYRKDGFAYVYPENSESGRSVIYILNEEHTKLEPLCDLCDKPITDAIIEEIEGKYYILTTLVDDPNGKNLTIYNLSDLPSLNNKIYKTTYCRSVVFDDNSARNGGRLLSNGNKKYKVSQDCNEYYGKGLVFYEMSGIGEYIESFRHYERGKIIGCHTYNEYKELGVIDGKMYKYHWLASFLHKFNPRRWIQ